MKRILSLVASVAASLLLATAAHAQFGFVAGLTSSSVKMASADAISLYHAGITAKIPLGSGFAIQPSLLYQVKGANVGHLDTATDEDFKVKTGFVELPLNFQWGPQLGSFRPFVFGEPFPRTSSSTVSAWAQGWKSPAISSCPSSGSRTWASCSASPRRPVRNRWSISRISRESSSPSLSFSKSFTDKSIAL